MKCELYHDNFQNFKRYNIPKAQLVIADIPYNIGVDAYASNPMWYNGGDNKNGESKLAKQSFFHTDGTFKIAEYMHFCNRMLRKEPKEKGQAPAMIVFCAFEQMQTVIEYGKRYGFMKSYPLFFCKNYSAQVLKANMKIVGATFTDEGDVVIDPCAGSGSTLRAAYEMGRNAYGFEVDKGFYEAAKEKMLAPLFAKPEFEQIGMEVLA